MRLTTQQMKLLGIALASFALASPALAQEAAAPAPRRPVEPRAEQILKAMSERLAALPRFAFEAEETFDEIPDGEPRMELTNLRRVAVERPNRVAADATGDTLERATWYDGRVISVLDKAHNVYAQIEVPDAIDAALDEIADDYGIVQPLADLLYSDVYAVLIEGVTYGRYLGIHRAAGVPCHHLAFAQETIEWQIWVDAGPDPLPRKLVITYVREPGEPQYAATIHRWSLDPKLPQELFVFTPPEGAEKVELSSLQGPGLGTSPAAGAREDVPDSPTGGR